MTSISRVLCRNHLSRFSARQPHRAFSVSSRLAAREVRIVEVGPRDGLQNEKGVIPVQTKIDLVERLAGTGLETIEAGSFVHPKWVPQMANSGEILQHVLKSPPKSKVPITYQWLLPNLKGLQNYFKVIDEHGGSPGSTPDGGPALNTSSQDPNAMPSTTSGAEAMSSGGGQPESEVSIFLAATETFSKKNTNCTIAESLERFKPLISQSRDKGVNVRAYVSVALGCPYEGPDVSPHKVAELTAALLEMGADEVSVADTTGMGTAPKTAELLKTLSAAGVQNQDLAFHFHDTYGQALVNTVVALEHGIRVFDSAVGGLGGCPFSPGATGNVATEDLIHCLHSLGVDTGVDLANISQIGSWLSQELGRENASRAGKATLANLFEDEIHAPLTDALYLDVVHRRHGIGWNMCHGRRGLEFNTVARPDPTDDLYSGFASGSLSELEVGNKLVYSCRLPFGLSQVPAISQPDLDLHCPCCGEDLKSANTKTWNHIERCREKDADALADQLFDVALQDYIGQGRQCPLGSFDSCSTTFTNTDSQPGVADGIRAFLEHLDFHALKNRTWYTLDHEQVNNPLYKCGSPGCDQRLNSEQKLKNHWMDALGLPSRRPLEPAYYKYCWICEAFVFFDRGTIADQEAQSEKDLSVLLRHSATFGYHRQMQEDRLTSPPACIFCLHDEGLPVMEPRLGKLTTV